MEINSEEYKLYTDIINGIHSNIDDQDEANNITDKLTELVGQLEPMVIPKIAEEKLRQMFRDNSDCYTEKSLSDTGENFVNEQALTEDGFVKLLKKLSNFSA
jgi:hypothetical protein